MRYIKHSLLLLTSLWALSGATAQSKKRLIDEVNPFIGTSNFGTTNPGAVLPNGLMSITPFNVMGGEGLNKWEKDSRWWSTPYSSDNKFFTGFAHVNLSGVGCPELGGFLLMASSDSLRVEHQEYGSVLSREYAKPGYYTAYIDKHSIKAEVTATERTALTAFTFDKTGKGNIILNLGQALTNESGASVRFVDDTTLVGTKLMGTFCYNPQAVFTQYFAMRISRKAPKSGYYKKQPAMRGVEAEWDHDHGKYKLYHNYRNRLSGDDLGVWFSYDVKSGETIYVQTAVSFVSEENALMNLEREQGNKMDFADLRREAEDKWERALSTIEVEGGTSDERTIFYTSLYHLLIHPNIMQDANGEYSMSESLKTGKTDRNRYTVYSLWDTYRNVHPLLSILYPKMQLDMVNSMLDIYKESGWLPKWELYGRETMTMTGDPSIIVLNDTWQRGIRGFDTTLAYEAMMKGATTATGNKLRPEMEDYLKFGYLPLRAKFDHSVSTSLEYYIADWNMAQFARAMGKTDVAKEMERRSLGYKHFYSKEYGLLRPITPDGKFLSPFDPKLGRDFEPNPGFHEGNSYNYSFFVPHDIKGLARLMGGERKFVDRLQAIFDKGNYDPANEPDIAYPYLFTYFPREAWRTQEITKQLIKTVYRNSPDGIPGNDDTGTMSAWAIFTMLGFYPDCPGSTSYALTTPTFKRVTLHLDKDYYPQGKLVIERQGEEGDTYFKSISLGDKTLTNTYRLDHKTLMNAGRITYHTTNRK